MKGKFKEISFYQAKDIITEDYFLKKSITNKGTISGGIRWGIFLSIIIFFFGWLMLAFAGVKNAVIYPLLGFVIPVNLIVILIISLVRKKELFLFKSALSSSFAWIYFGGCTLAGVFFPKIYKTLMYHEILNFSLYLFLVCLSLWIIIYTYQIFLQNIYEKLGLYSKKSKFNKFYRKIALWIAIAGVILAYAFRNIPGSHGSTAPQWLQYIGIIGLSIAFCIIPCYFFLNDIIKGLLIREYYKEFEKLYKIND